MLKSFGRIDRLFMLMILLLGTILAGCNSDSESSSGTSTSDGELTPIKLQLKWVPQAQFAGYFVALEKGYYEEEGLDVTILPGGPDIVPEQQVANGTAQIGVNWVASLLPHQAEGMPLVQIAQIYQKSGLLLVTKKDSGIQSPADLAGKRLVTGWAEMSLKF